MPEPLPAPETPTVDEPAQVATPPREELPTAFGRYRVVSRLGAGGFGTVYLGRDDELQRDVAIKVPRRDRVASADDVQAYLAEARALARLDHPGIVPVYDVGRTCDGLPYGVSRYVDGGDLAARLRQDRLTLAETATLVAQVAEALHHAHCLGIVHRDVKPGNILLAGGSSPSPRAEATPVPVVADFGLALREEDFGTGPICAGTPAYMSPEQARGEGHRVDARTDVYSLGVVLYELLTGRLPFQGENASALLRQVIGQEPRPPRQLDPTVPRNLDRICLKCLAKRAGDRYSTAADLAEDLRQWLADAPAPATVPVEKLAVGAPTPSSPPVTPSSVAIVPRGLRSFDAHDASFFLELLPGPRDACGLPESLRFWKARVEETDADQTFRVGLLYGPSGCGKSSLVKAGLLPRLASGIEAVFVEAAPGDTEARLLRALGKRCPQATADGTLPGTLTALRRGRGLASGRKLLLVLDQFEQWLHTWEGDPEAELIRTLRQCDGGRVQALLLVRDDFWMAVTRFFHALEVRLIEGHNSAAVDLFDPPHARKVLALFGQAYGRLVNGANKEQERFLDLAVAGLLTSGKVVPVHLSLFAELAKGRPWEPAALRAVGGPSGLGVAFLEDTFGGRTAPPEHRRHEKAARAVLERLLPETGTVLKGHLRSRQELLDVAGYAERPRDFDDLLDILDAELRLITPVDPESAGSTAATGPSYQLTHDNLVPALRQWLTRKRSETHRGRAELRLEARAAEWTARPESRNLPSWWEWTRIQLLTRSATWSEPQRALMRAAGRYHALRGFLLGLLFAGLLFVGFFVRSLIQESHARNAAFLVAKLLQATAEDVPLILPEMERQREFIEPALRAKLAAAPAGSRDALRARLGLLAFDAEQVHFLRGWLFDMPLEELLAVREALKPHIDAAGVDGLWAVIEGQNAEKGHRLRAACVLAELNPTSPRWEGVSTPLVDALTEQPLPTLETWAKGFEPVRLLLQAPLARIAREGKTAPRRAAVRLLAQLALDQPRLLAELLLDGEPAVLPTLLVPLRAHADEALALFSQELGRTPTVSWNDEPTTHWPLPDPKAVQSVEAGHGLVAERFALVQTLPLQDAVRAAEALRPAGYRLMQFRPFEFEGRIRVAALWQRDGKPWQLAHGVTAPELERLDTEKQKAGLIPLDVSGYLGAEGAEQYAAIWGSPDRSVTEARLLVGKPIHLPLMEGPNPAKGFSPRTRSTFAVSTGLRASAVWENRGAARSPIAVYSLPDLGFHQFERQQEGTAAVWTDLRVERAVPLNSRRLFTEYLAEAEHNAEKDSASAHKIRYTIAWALFGLGQEQKALDHLTALLAKDPTGQGGRAYEDCAILHARLGRAREARQVLANCARHRPGYTMLPWARAVVEACLDEGDQGEAAILSYMAESPENVYYAACAYGCAAGVVARKDPARGARYLERTLDLLDRSVSHSWISDWFVNPYIVDLHTHPGFPALVQKHGRGLWCSGTAYHGLPFVSSESHGLEPQAHLTRCREFAAAGARPVAISAAAVLPGDTVVTASVWHQPAVTEAGREALVRRQANAAAALLSLGPTELVWPLLRRSEDPRLRTYLIHGLAISGINPRLLRSQIASEPESSARQALLLALGEYSDSMLPDAERSRLVEELLPIYRDDPDPGVHSAAGWLLRRWGLAERVRALEQPLLSSEPRDERRWYVNRQGQTLAVLPGPQEFPMGSPPSEGGRLSDERQHMRLVPRTFALGTTEVTREQFERFRKLRTNASSSMPDAECPALSVTWIDAAQYCRWLSEQEGIPEAEMCYPRLEDIKIGLKLPADFLKRTGYRLPTEAEWELACRAGSTTPRFYGHDDSLLGEYAWYTQNAKGRSWPVGRLRPNAFGLFDILGNAHEWCHDLSAPYPRSQPGRAVEDRGRVDEVIQNMDQRVYRGRGFNTEGSYFRSAGRNKGLLTDSFAIGFRVARTLR